MDETPVPANADARVVGPDRGVAWWAAAWALFTKSALLWIALGVILIAGFVLISMIPFLGALATALLTPVFVGSWLLAARKVEGGGVLEFSDLYSCFKNEHFTALLVLGGLLLAAVVVVGLVVGMLGFSAMFGMMGGAREHMAGPAAAMGVGMLAITVMLLLGMLISIAFWFAPALVVFRNAQPVDALRASGITVLKNWLPFLVYGLLYIVAAIVASIPLGLGWILLVPVLLLTMYVSYKDVFEG